MGNRIVEILGIQYPVFQGGMAWVSEHNLVSAVSEAGGLGIIAASNFPAERVEAEIKAVRARTDQPFGVNIMLLSPHADEIAELVIREKVPVVTTGAGNPEKYLSNWKQAGIKVIPVVASVAVAKRVERHGADAVIAEGMESGGHIGQLTSMALLPQVCDAVSIPVIAAGGIADGRGMAAAFILGAEAVQMGTRFLVSEESVIHQAYKEKVLKAKDIDTQVTGIVHGHPVRSIRNKMTSEYLKLEAAGADFVTLEALTIGSLRKAVQEGDVTNGTLMAGQIAGMVKKSQTCREIIQEILAQSRKYLNVG